MAYERRPPTVKQVQDDQRKIAAHDRAAKAAAVSKTNGSPGTAVAPAAKPALPAVPDSRSAHDRYLDSVSPIAIVGRLAKFDPKRGAFVTPDDDAVITEDAIFAALADQTQIAWVRYYGEGTPPTRVAGLLYDGFAMPERETLGDTDPSQWELGLSGTPQDPWQHQMNVVLQNTDTDELLTFSTSSVTGRRAVGTLLRHFDRMEKQGANAYPLVTLRCGGFMHRDERIGRVNTPVFAICGRVPKADAAKPDTVPAAPFNDEIPY